MLESIIFSGLLATEHTKQAGIKGWGHMQMGREKGVGSGWGIPDIFKGLNFHGFFSLE
jgi:hypothetical protein